MQVVYADTSAVVKLVQPEAGSAALRAWLGARRWVVSDLHRTELRRAALRTGVLADATLVRADRLLAELDTIRLHGSVFDGAGRLEPAGLGSLDALHLAAARTLGPDLAGLVAYDDRLIAAAGHHGITTWSPV
ncbi:MAG: type II toxin-antitoxin system VapC family toxin [Acidimicrobiales bacterium]